MTLAILKKTSGEVLDYSLDFSGVLETGETLSTHTASVIEGTGLTIDSSSISGDSVTVFLSSGTAGETYAVKVSATTSSARTYERAFIISIVSEKER